MKQIVHMTFFLFLGLLGVNISGIGAGIETIAVDGPHVSCKNLKGRSNLRLFRVPASGSRFIVGRDILNDWEKQCHIEIPDFEIAIQASGRVLTVDEAMKRIDGVMVSRLEWKDPLWVLGNEKVKVRPLRDSKVILESQVDQVEADLIVKKSAFRLKENTVSYGDVVTFQDVEPVMELGYSESLAELATDVDFPKKLNSLEASRVLLRKNLGSLEMLANGTKVSVMVRSGSLELKTDGNLVETATMGRPVRVYIPQTQRTLVGLYRGNSMVEVNP